MSNKKSEIMGNVFPNFYKNNNAKKRIEKFFNEFDSNILSKFYRDIQREIGKDEELVYQSETKSFDYYLEYDAVANYLLMKIYYKDSPNIIEKRLSTFTQFIKKTITEKYEYRPAFSKRSISDVTYGVKAEVIVEEYGKNIGSINVKKESGDDVASIDVSNYLKQWCYAVNEEDNYFCLQNLIYGGDVKFENVVYNNCGYVEQKSIQFDDAVDFSLGKQSNRTTKRNLFVMVDNKIKKELFSEVFDYDNLNKGDFEIMCHTTARFGSKEDSKYYIRKCPIKTDEKREL